MILYTMRKRRQRAAAGGGGVNPGGTQPVRRSPFVALTRNFVRSSFRNRTALIFTIGLAILFMVIFGELFSGGNQSVTIGIVDNDHDSKAVQQFVSTLKGYEGVTVEVGDAAVENDRLAKNKVDAVAVLPTGLQRTLDSVASGARTRPAQIALSVASTTSPTASFAGGVLSAAATSLATGGHTAVYVSAPQPGGANHITSIDFLLPSMIAYIILQSGINYVAIGLVELRVRKVLRRLRSTPLTSAQILSAQVCGGALTVLIQIVFLIAVGKLLFGAENYGNWLLVALPIVLGTGAFVGIGFLLTSAARTSEAARGLASMIALPMMFLSGIFFPIDSAPQWLQTVVHILPLTWLTDALHQVMNNNAGLGDIAVDCLVLTAWAVVTLVIATLRFRWD